MVYFTDTLSYFPTAFNNLVNHFEIEFLNRFHMYKEHNLSYFGFLGTTC